MKKASLIISIVTLIFIFSSCKDDRSGKMDYYKEPVLKMGESVDYVKKHEKRNLIEETQDDDGLYMLRYGGDNRSVKDITYYFQNGKLVGSIVEFDRNYSIAADLHKFLNKKYRYVSDYIDGMYRQYIWKGESGQNLFYIIMVDDSEIGFAELSISYIDSDYLITDDLLVPAQKITIPEFNTAIKTIKQ